MPDTDFQRIVLNLIPKQGDEPVVFYASQYESARPFIADLMWGDTEFAPGDSCRAEIDIRKNDDNLVVITDDVSIDNNEVSVILPVQAVTCIGKNLGQVKIYAADDQLIAALNFILEVQPDPLAGGVTSETAIDNLTTQIDDIISGEGYVKDTDLDVLQSDWDEADPTSPAYIKNKPSSGAQVQADWTEADTTSPAYIQNKPTLSTVATTGDYDDLLNKPTIPAAQVQSDYAQTNSGAVDFIKNKPELPFETKGQYLLKNTPATKRSIEFTTLIGGTCGVNQLATGFVTQTVDDLTLTNNNDGSITVNGTASANGDMTITGNIYFLSTHKYLVKGYKKVGSNNGSLSISGVGIDSGNGNIWNNDISNINLSLRFAYSSEDAFNNVVMYPQIIDLTAYFGTTIADYAYTLESGTSGAGITWLKNNGFFNEAYYPYNSGGLLSVKTSKKINRDSNNVIIGEYPLDDIELRGILKLDGNNNLYYDGDTYSSSGEVYRKYEYRAYASGDESLPDTITDGTNTVTKLVTPTFDTADPFTNPMIVDGNGTEEFVDGRTVEIPVGHDTFYIPMN